MEKNIINADPAGVSLDAFLTGLHMDEKRKTLYDSVVKMYDDAMGIAKPVAFYLPFTPYAREDSIWINGIGIKEPFVHKMLSGRDTVVPFVASCGREVDEWSRSFSGMFEQFAVDMLKEMLLEAAMKELFREAQEKYFDEDKSISTINPGSLVDWPITGQTQLFSILGDVTTDIGVVLSKSMLMIPTKSESGIIFQSDEEYHNCQLCPRVDCPKRHTPHVSA